MVMSATMLEQAAPVHKIRNSLAQNTDSKRSTSALRGSTLLVGCARIARCGAVR